MRIVSRPAKQLFFITDLVRQRASTRKRRGVYLFPSPGTPGEGRVRVFFRLRNADFGLRIEGPDTPFGRFQSAIRNPKSAISRTLTPARFAGSRRIRSLLPEYRARE